MSQTVLKTREERRRSTRETLLILRDWTPTCQSQHSWVSYKLQSGSYQKTLKSGFNHGLLLPVRPNLWLADDAVRRCGINLPPGVTVNAKQQILAYRSKPRVYRQIPRQHMLAFHEMFFGSLWFDLNNFSILHPHKLLSYSPQNV